MSRGYGKRPPVLAIGQPMGYSDLHKEPKRFLSSPSPFPPMTAQAANHIAHLAFLRASASAFAPAEQWDAVVALKQLARTIAEREIEANGYSMIHARLA